MERFNFTHTQMCKFVYFDQNKNGMKNWIVGASGSSVSIKVSAFFSPTLPSPIPLLSSIHATSSHREDSVTTRQARPSPGESRNLNDSVISGRLLEALLFHRPHCKVIFLVPIILNSIDRAPRVEISSAERRENSYKESNKMLRS